MIRIVGKIVLDQSNDENILKKREVKELINNTVELKKNSSQNIHIIISSIIDSTQRLYHKRRDCVNKVIEFNRSCTKYIEINHTHNTTIPQYQHDFLNTIPSFHAMNYETHISLL